MCSSDLQGALIVLGGIVASQWLLPEMINLTGKNFVHSAATGELSDSLYLRYADVAQAAQHLREVLDTREWDQPRFRVRGSVT